MQLVHYASSRALDVIWQHLFILLTQLFTCAAVLVTSSSMLVGMVVMMLMLVLMVVCSRPADATVW
jgi:hypothetical protein